MKIIKYILFSIIALILLLAIGIFIFFLTFDLNHYKSFVEQRASNTLKRPVKIESLSTKLSLVPMIEVKGLRILDEEQNTPLLEIPQADATIELLPLWNKQISIQLISIPNANFNWKYTPSKKTESKPEEKAKTAASKNINLPKLWIEKFQINTLNCQVEKDKKYDFKIDNFTVTKLSKFSFNFLYEKEKIKVSGNLGSLLELLSKKDKLPVNLTFENNRSTLKLNGQIDDVPNLKKMRFQANFNTPNLAGLLTPWKISSKMIPSLPTKFTLALDGNLDRMNISKFSLEVGKEELLLNVNGTASSLKTNPQGTLTTTLSLKQGDLSQKWQLKPLEMSGKLNLTKSQLNLEEVKLNAGKSDAWSEGIINWEKTPLLIQGKVISAYFDVNDLIAQNTQKASNQQKSNAAPAQNSLILSAQKLPLDSLKKIDMNAKVQVNHLKFSDEIIDHIALNTTVNIKNGNLTMPAQIKMLDGNVQVNMNVDANQKSSNLKMNASNLQLDQIKALKKEIQGITTNAEITLSGKGDSIHTIMAHSNGKIVMELMGGKILNKWFNTLPSALNLFESRSNSLALTGGNQKTNFLCGAVNLTVNNGIANSKEQIAFETDTLNCVLNGTINFKDETVNLSMIPSVQQGIGQTSQLLNASQFVTLKGPWKNIKPGVDSQKMGANLVNAVAQKLTNTQTQTTTPVSEKSLCQKALGRSLTQQPKSTTKTVKEQPKKATQQPTTQKPDLKQQLLQSLSQALTNQVTAKKQ